MTTTIGQIDTLNNRALEIYLADERRNDEGEREAAARDALESAARENGLVEIDRDNEPNSYQTRIYRNEGGALVNCWIGSPDISLSESDFSGLGFDGNVEWHTERESIAAG